MHFVPLPFTSSPFGTTFFGTEVFGEGPVQLTLLLRVEGFCEFLCTFVYAPLTEVTRVMRSVVRWRKLRFFKGDGETYEV